MKRTWKPKPWHAHFEVRNIIVPKVDINGNEIIGMLKVSWAIFNKKTGEKVSKRNYSDEGGARRGAAQIYNAVERSLLG